MTTDTRTYAGSLRPGTVIRWRDRHGVENTDEVTHTQRYGADCVLVVTRTGRTYHWGTTDTVEVLDAAAAEWRDAQARREQRERTAALLRQIADAVDAGTCDPIDEDTWRRAVKELDARELTPDAAGGGLLGAAAVLTAVLATRPTGSPAAGNNEGASVVRVGGAE